MENYTYTIIYIAYVDNDNYVVSMDRVETEDINTFVKDYENEVVLVFAGWPEVVGSIY